MIATSDVIASHLSAARREVDAVALATVRAARKPRKELVHIDAAQHLMVAAVELFSAAEDIAAGKLVKGHGAQFQSGQKLSPLAVSLRIAEAKIREAQGMLDEATGRDRKIAGKANGAIIQG